MSEAFKKFCNHICIEHITYPVRDHKGNGKIERLYQLGRELNTMDSNAVSKFLDISEQDNSLEISPADFQDDLD